MAKLTPDQIRKRERVETLIKLMAPAMNLVLAAGERLSRVVEPDDPEYYPARVEPNETVSIGGESPRGAAQE
jgi:hypothetical protein